jgi:UDP-glucose 4-epimerase
MLSKKILVTGASGYIGSHTCLELLNAGHEIIALDNFSNSKIESLMRVKQISNKDFEIIECNLLDKIKLSHIFKNYEISSVIHFAGLKAVGESVENPLLYYTNNVIGSINLFLMMAESDIKKIVFSSSATVYGDPDYLPINEEHPLRTTNPYGETKLIIENILRNLYESDNKWDIAILRYFNPCGAHESGIIGEDPNGIPNNLMPYISQVASGKYETLNIFGNDYNTHDGTGIRDYIHVVDLAVAHVKSLNLNKNNSGCKALNLGTGKGYSVYDIVKAFRKVSGKEIPINVTDRRMGDIAICYADANEAKKSIKWVAKKNLIDMCKDHWRWQSQNINGYNISN